MNSIKRRLLPLIVITLMAWVAEPVYSQIAYYYDASGNPTNSFLSASTGLGMDDASIVRAPEKAGGWSGESPLLCGEESCGIEL